MKEKIIKIKNEIFRNRKYIVGFVLCFILLLSIAQPVQADVGKAVATLLGWIAAVITSVLGWILLFLLKILVNVAQFNNIIDVPAVANGWKIVRDICNMLFVLILLVIAFATILRYENFSIKRLLPKLIIMAVLINFSRMIFGLIIDFSQVIMLTFVNGFGDVGANNLAVMFQIKEMAAVEQGAEAAVTGISGWASSVGIITGVIALLITLIVVVVMLAVLVMRVIMLWIYTILSPIVFLGFAFPPIQKYAGRIWEDFIKQVITGPLLAFFLWLALTTASTSSSILGSNTLPGAEGELCAGPVSLFCEGNFQTFIIVIGLLMGGLIVTQQMGGAAGSAAGKGMAAIQRGKGAVTGYVNKAKTKSWGGVKWGADWLNRKQATRSGIDLNTSRFAGRIKASSERSKARDLSGADLVASSRLQKGGFTGAIGGITATGWADQHLRGFLGRKGIQSAFAGGQKNVEKWRGEQEKNEWMAKHSFDTEGKYNNTFKDLKSKAGKAGDADRVAELNKEIKGMDDNKKELIGKGRAEQYTKEAKKYSELASKYTVQNYQGQKVRRAGVGEELSKITSTNEDELAVQFENAVAHNNAPQASAIALAITKVGGANTLLNKYGYQAKGGLTKDEARDATRETYEKEKGFNDFMRDIFGDKLKMDEQNMLSLQSDIGSIGEHIGHEYVIKNTKVNRAGQFEQASSSEREQNKLNERLKREPEGVIRKHNRLEYGSENKDTREFEWSDSGLAYFIANAEIVAKEIGLKRFNRSAAKAVAEKDALKTMLDKMHAADINEVKWKDAPNGKGFISRDEFGELLKGYAKNTSDESKKRLLS